MKGLGAVSAPVIISMKNEARSEGLLTLKKNLYLEISRVSQVSQVSERIATAECVLVSLCQAYLQAEAEAELKLSYEPLRYR